MRGKTLMFLLLLCLTLVFSGSGIIKAIQLNRELDRLQQELQGQELQMEVTRTLLDEVRRLRAENEELRQKMMEWLETWDVVMAEVSAYAPLDPEAAKGMCYSGDPRITASGAEVVPGVTAAAAPGVPFGTRIYICGHGPRIIQDRGGRIGPGKIDLAVESRGKAITWGRRTVKVVYQK